MIIVDVSDVVSEGLLPAETTLTIWTLEWQVWGMNLVVLRDSRTLSVCLVRAIAAEEQGRIAFSTPTLVDSSIHIKHRL